MKQLKNLTILLTFLSLVAFISCGNEGSTGSDDRVIKTKITESF